MVAKRSSSATLDDCEIKASPYVLIPRAAQLTGYSIRAIELKIYKGEWVEGREWRKSPDGRRQISMEGFARWVERGA